MTTGAWQGPDDLKVWLTVAVAKRKTDGDARPVSELAALVQAENDRGTSYEKMAARARRAGQTVTGGYLHQLKQGRVRHPAPEKVPAIASALGLKETQVREAIARDTGVHVEHNLDYRTRQLLHAIEDLDPVTRDRWFRLAQTIALTLASETSSITSDGSDLDPFSQRRLDAQMGEMRENYRRQRGDGRHLNES